MHNYAISALHRKESDVDLEHTRVLVIIQSMLDCRRDCIDDMTWCIPNGWAKAQDN